MQGTGEAVDRDLAEVVLQDDGLGLFQLRDGDRGRGGLGSGGLCLAGLCSGTGRLNGLRRAGRGVLLRGLEHPLIFLGPFRLIFRHVDGPCHHEEAADGDDDDCVFVEFEVHAMSFLNRVSEGPGRNRPRTRDCT